MHKHAQAHTATPLQLTLPVSTGSNKQGEGMEGDRDRPGVGIVKTASHTHTPSLTSGTPADPRRPHSRPQQAVVQTWSCRCQTARAQNTRNLKYLRSRLCAQLPSWFKTKPFLQRSLQGSHPTVMTQTRDAFDAPLAHVHGRQNHASTPPSSSCLPYPGILQGTYHMATRPYRRRTTKWSNIPVAWSLDEMVVW